MFTWLNKQGVKADDGFVVQFTGRFTAEYRDSGRKVTLAVEDGFVGGKPCVAVEPEAFDRWDDDPPGVTIPPDQRARMFTNLREALEFQGLILVVSKGDPIPGA
jgi:hypothetical protein